MFAKDVHETEKKRSLKRKKITSKKWKKSFFSFQFANKTSGKEKKRRGRSCTDPWQDQSQDIHRSDKEKDISRPCWKDIAFHRPIRKDRSQWDVASTMQLAIQGAHLQHSEAWIKQSDVHSQKNGKNQTHRKATTNSKTSQRNKRCTRTLTTEDEPWVIDCWEDWITHANGSDICRKRAEGTPKKS